MNIVTHAMLFFLATGNYILFWPIYRLFHSRKTRRRQALLRLFLLEVVLYSVLTGSLVFAVYRIPDFHHGGFFLAEVAYVLLALAFWVATYGVWGDNSPYEVES